MPTLDNPRHERFAQLIAEGKVRQFEAYKAVYLDVTDSTAYVNASKLLADTDISARVSDIQRQMLEKLELLTLAKKRSLLAQFATADLSKPPEELLKLANGVKYDRETGRVAEIRLPSKIDAIQLDARIMGELQDNQATGPTVVNINLQRLMLTPDQPAQPVIDAETGIETRQIQRE